MNVAMRLALLLMLNGSLPILADSVSLAGQEHPRGGQGSKQMSNRASDNSNAQWSADPKRGWVRGDARRDIVEEKDSTNSSRANRGKAKAGAKSKKAL
jgi:hypothetical protein